MANQFLIKETMADMKALSIAEITALQGTNPAYAGVELLGYYEKGDTPAPIIYYYVDLQNEPDPGPDDGGSIIEIGNNKLRHDFKGADLYDIYFGYKTGVFFTKEQNNLKLNRMYNSGTNSIVHSPGVEADISESLIINNENLKIEGNGFVIRQADNSSLITYVDRPLIDIISNGVIIEDMVLDDNIDNNFVMLGSNKIHAANSGDIPGTTRIGHDVLLIRASNVVARRVKVEGASWTGIKVTYDPNNVEVNNVIIEDCVVNQTFRDSISIMHCRNVKVRNNKIVNGIHHQIHVYTNTLNTEVSGNYSFNKLEDIFLWYTGIDLESYERGCIIIDHISYDKKTVNTVISNNTVIANSLSDFKAGVVTQGYPENVIIKNNLFARCTRGLFIARGNPVGDICTITGNAILESVNGVHFWPATTGENYGGKTTPQQSKIVLSGNNIESSDMAIRVSGSVENVQNFYSLYNVLLEGNTINGKPDLTLSQELNFSGNALGTHKIIYKNNIEEYIPNIVNAQTVKNLLKGTSEVYIDKYYRFRSQEAIDITNTVSGKYYKVFTFISKNSYVLSGLIQITDYRQVPEIANIQVYVKGLNPLRTSMNQLSLSTSVVDNNLTPANIFWNITTDADKIKYELYIKANTSNRDWKINFSELYLNSNVINTDIIVYNRPDPEDNLPMGSNISSISPVRLSYNASTYIQGIQSVNATNQSNLTATTVTDLVSQINTLFLPKFNDVVALVNETKAKTNQSISTEVASGQRRPS